MAYRIDCPKCDSELTMKNAPPPGKKITCPECEHRFIAENDERDEPPPPKKTKRPIDNRDDDDERGDRPRKKLKKKSKGQSSSLPLILAGGGVLALVVIAAVVVVVILLVNRKDSSSSGSATSKGAGGSGTSSASDSGWGPDQKYRDQLGPSAKAGGSYMVDVPKGYTLLPPTPSGNGVSSSIVSNEPNLLMFFIYVENSSKEVIDYYVKQPSYDVEKNCDRDVKGFVYRDIIKDAPQQGKLSGGTFYRIHFKATSATGKKASGFYYTGIVGNDIIMMWCVANEPVTDETVKLFESAALTLKK